MAGGIFVDRPFHPNPKCILFAGALMGSYWYLPHKNPFLLPLIFIVGYITMAWYDYLYECKSKLYSGTSIGPNSIDTWGKPQRRNLKSNKDDLVKDQETAYKRNVYLFHVLFIAPILYYAGYKNSNLNPQFFPLILGTGLMGLVYHGLRMFYARQTSCKDDEAERSNLVTIYLLHVLAIVPLFLYVGYYAKSSDNRVWNILLYSGILTFIYHLVRYFRPRKC